MTVEQWSSAITAILGVAVVIFGGLRWILKKYILDVTETLKELKPNSGSSLKDQVTRLERRMDNAEFLNRELNNKIDKIYDILLSNAADKFNQ